MPLLDHQRLQGHRQKRLAHLQLTIIASGYVWQHGDKDASKVRQSHADFIGQAFNCPYFFVPLHISFLIRKLGSKLIPMLWAPWGLKMGLLISFILFLNFVINIKHKSISKNKK